MGWIDFVEWTKYWHSLHKPSHKPSEQTDAVEFIFFTLQIFFKMENIKHKYKSHSYSKNQITQVPNSL